MIEILKPANLERNYDAVRQLGMRWLLLSVSPCQGG